MNTISFIGSATELTCKTKGAFVAAVDWYYDNKIVKASDYYEIVRIIHDTIIHFKVFVHSLHLQCNLNKVRCIEF